MPKDIRALSTELASDPTSLAFLPLGEELRRRGQLDAAERVARMGLSRHPNLADAHDLLARIHSDRYDFEQAFDEWDQVLHLAPHHAGAHKGLGFLYFRVGDLSNAIIHLGQASELSSEDQSITRALETVRAFAVERTAVEGAPSTPTMEPPGEQAAGPAVPETFEGFEGGHDSVLLLDEQGLVLAGGIRAAGQDVSEAVAAHFADVADECSRTARLLGLGDWQGLSAEARHGNLHIARPTPATLLLVLRDKSVPLGRIAVFSNRVAQTARRWLEQRA